MAPTKLPKSGRRGSATRKGSNTGNPGRVSTRSSTSDSINRRLSSGTHTGSIAEATRRSSTGDFIDQSLLHMGEDELTDTIRLAQRLLKAKTLTRRQALGSTEKRPFRFWARPLELDWNSTGIPSVQFPRGRACTAGDETQRMSRQFSDGMMSARTSLFGPRDSAASNRGFAVSLGGPPQVDLRVFQLLSPTSKEKVKAKLAAADIDWNVLSLMSPESNAKVVDLFLAGEDFDDGDWNAVDWSNGNLPYYNNVSAARRRDRRHTRDRRVHGNPHGAVSADPPSSLLLRMKQMEVEKTMSNPPRRHGSMLRAAPRMAMQRARHLIQQPCGGGR